MLEEIETDNARKEHSEPMLGFGTVMRNVYDHLLVAIAMAYIAPWMIVALVFFPKTTPCQSFLDTFKILSCSSVFLTDLDKNILCVAMLCQIWIFFFVPIFLSGITRQDDPKILSRQELKLHSNFPFLGDVPKIPVTGGRLKKLMYLSKKPNSGTRNALANVRSSITLSQLERPLENLSQIIAVTSSLPGEGKTTVATALAVDLAAARKKVLLIDGDIRRRILSGVISEDATSINVEKNLISALQLNAPLEDFIVRPQNFDFDVLTCKHTDIAPADIFETQGFKAVLDQARKHYDFILIDTPPILIGADSRILILHADFTVFVVKWNATRTSSFLSAMDLIPESRAIKIGILLNNVKSVLPRIGFAIYYGYYYTKPNSNRKT